jgi:hypothetical protein
MNLQHIPHLTLLGLILCQKHGGGYGFALNHPRLCKFFYHIFVLVDMYQMFIVVAKKLNTQTILEFSIVRYLKTLRKFNFNCLGKNKIIRY